MTWMGPAGLPLKWRYSDAHSHTRLLRCRAYRSLGFWEIHLRPQALRGNRNRVVRSMPCACRRRRNRSKRYARCIRSALHDCWEAPCVRRRLPSSTLRTFARKTGRKASKLPANITHSRLQSSSTFRLSSAPRRNRGRANRTFWREGCVRPRSTASQVPRNLTTGRLSIRSTFSMTPRGRRSHRQSIREPLYNDRRGDRGPFDIIGDVQGRFDELMALLVKLGYSRRLRVAP